MDDEIEGTFVISCFFSTVEDPLFGRSQTCIPEEYPVGFACVADSQINALHINFLSLLDFLVRGLGGWGAYAAHHTS